MSEVIFSESYDLLEKPDYRYVVEAIERSNVRTSVLIQAGELAFRRLDKKLFRDAIRGRNLFIRFVNELLQKRMSAKPLQRHDVFSFLLSAKDPETQEGLRVNEIGAESTTMVVAGTSPPPKSHAELLISPSPTGSDTSSTAIASVFFYLARFPEAYRKATEEVRSAFSTPQDVTLGPALNSCVYLRACIDESLRMSPPAASSLWREVCGHGAVIDGRAFPAGTEVGVCIHAIHHNKDYYPEPYTFRPERWLTTTTAEGSEKTELVGDGEHTRARSVFNPFSVGPRSCIGKGLANAELMLTMASVFMRFDFRTPDGPEGKIGEGAPGLGAGREREKEFQLYDHITASKNGPMVQFRKLV